MALACGYEVVKHTIEHKVVEHAASLEPVMVEEMQRLVDEHPCVRQGRSVIQCLPICLLTCFICMFALRLFLEETPFPRSIKLLVVSDLLSP